MLNVKLQNKTLSFINCNPKHGRKPLQIHTYIASSGQFYVKIKKNWDIEGR